MKSAPRCVSENSVSASEPPGGTSEAARSETDPDQTVSVNELCQKEALSAI